MWNFSLEDYRQLSMEATQLVHVLLEQTSSQVVTCLLEPVLQWRKQLPFPRCLWDLWRGWRWWTSRRSPAELAMARPSQRCWSCVTAGRSLEPLCRASACWCPRRGLRSISVTMSTSLRRSSKCHQRVTVTDFVHVCFAVICHCCFWVFDIFVWQTRKQESGVFHLRTTRDSVSNDTGFI